MTISKLLQINETIMVRARGDPQLYETRVGDIIYLDPGAPGATYRLVSLHRWLHDQCIADFRVYTAKSQPYPYCWAHDIMPYRITNRMQKE